MTTASEGILRAAVRARTRIRSLAAPVRMVEVSDTVRRDLAGVAPRSGPVWLADDTVQATGAFKLRGAASALTALAPSELQRGVVAVSTGNHGRAVAHVARALGTTATVFLSVRVPEGKVRALRDAGAEVRIQGDGQDEAERHALAFAAESGATFVPPFDHPEVIAGQATLGLEILEAVPDVATVVVPLSGGGLAAGVVGAMRAVRPEVRAVGVSMLEGAAMIQALRAGKPVPTEEAATLADSLQGGLGADNRYTFEAVRTLLHAAVQVPEAALAEAMRWAFVQHRLVLEGAGAAAIAAWRGNVLTDADTDPAGAVVLIASGAAVDLQVYAHVLAGGDGLPGSEEAG